MFFKKCKISIAVLLLVTAYLVEAAPGIEFLDYDGVIDLLFSEYTVVNL